MDKERRNEIIQKAWDFVKNDEGIVDEVTGVFEYSAPAEIIHGLLTVLAYEMGVKS